LSPVCSVLKAFILKFAPRQGLHVRRSGQSDAHLGRPSPRPHSESPAEPGTNQFRQFPHFPQSIRIHNQYTPRLIVPFMLPCIVTVAIKFPHPARQDASLLRFSRPLFIESLFHRPSAFLSSVCVLLVRSFTQERKSTPLFSCACARFRRTRGSLRSSKNSPCYHQLAKAKITLWEKLSDCTHPGWQCHPQSDLR
jgi:hypothetical protein